MIKEIHIDEEKYPCGFAAVRVKSEESEVLNKSARGNFYHIFFVKKGEFDLQIDLNSITVKAGECAFIGINQVFKIETKSRFDVLLLRFNESFYCRNETDIRFLNSCAFFNPTELFKYHLELNLQIILEQHYNSLSELCINKLDELSFMMAHNSVERLLLFCQKEFIRNRHIQPQQQVNPDNELANKFRQLVKTYFTTEKQLKFYTDKLNTSTKRLTEVCNNIYGASPKKIIMEQTVLEAKRLLLYSPNNVKEIAFKLNFDEPSNFIRFFNNYVGMSPKEYRENAVVRNSLLPNL